MKRAVYGIVSPGQQWHFIYLCCIHYCKCGGDHGMESQITVYVWRVCKRHLICMFWRSQLSVLQRHNLIWRVDRRMNRQTNWWMVWTLERLWDPPISPEMSRLVSLFPNNWRFFSHVPCSQYCLCTLFHSKFDLCSLFPWNKCNFPCFPKPLGGTTLCGCHI